MILHVDEQKELANNNYLLATGELELGTTQSFDDRSLPAVSGAYRHDGLTDTHTCYCALGLAEGTSHPSLEPEINKRKFMGNILCKDWMNINTVN